MKKIPFFIAVLVLLALAGSFGYKLVYAGPCQKPVEYSVGIFSTQFGISQDDFLKNLRTAEAVWEGAAGKELFRYNPEAKFSINLIYDERQRNVLLKQRTESGLDAAETIFRQADATLGSYKAEYDGRAAAYEEKTAEFKRRSAEYEKTVEYWNGRGGAPKKEYQQLETARQALNVEAAALNAEVAAINQMSAELNQIVKKRNLAAENYNDLAAGYNKKYESGLEFDQAEYTGKEINIYEFTNQKDLTLAMAHEFGHALGIGHVENTKSVMYYMTGGQGALVLSAEDTGELKNVCKIK